jgi:hypothetical protein
MENLVKRLIIYSLLFILPGFAMAQSLTDKAEVLQKCIDLPELQAYYPLDDAGTPVQIYVMQYPVSFESEFELVKFGQSVLFMDRSEINEDEIEAYFMFRSFDLTQNTAKVNLNYFYNYNYGTKQFNMVSVIIELQKSDTLWSVSDINLKSSTR